MAIVFDQLLTILKQTKKEDQNQSSSKSSKNFALDSR
ncbi:hypothetical protein ACVW1K_004017 [Bacillus subtilis]